MKLTMLKESLESLELQDEKEVWRVKSSLLMFMYGDVLFAHPCSLHFECNAATLI